MWCSVPQVDGVPEYEAVESKLLPTAYTVI